MRRVSNPPNPWTSEQVEWLGEPPAAELVVHEETARSILAENDSPDVPFRWGCNPYRGCHHACSYCYARPTHEYLGFGAGTDFERQLVVKTNAPELLARHFAKRSWVGERVAFSGVTDCYQPLEASYGLTRACLEVCRDHRNPVVIVTKGALVERDAELLADLGSHAHLVVYLSIPVLDAETSAALEPGASTPARRLAALRALGEAGVTTGVAVAPIVPGLNDAEIPAILQAAADAGARHAFQIPLRLPGSTRAVFLERLAAALPHRARRVESALRELRDGELNSPRFGERMRGLGARWAAVEAVFEQTCRRLGLGGREQPVPTDTFRRPRADDGQGRLFG